MDTYSCLGFFFFIVSSNGFNLPLDGAPFGIIGIGSRTFVVKVWRAPEKYAGKGPNDAVLVFSSFSPSSIILLRNAITLSDCAADFEALKKATLDSLRSSWKRSIRSDHCCVLALLSESKAGLAFIVHLLATQQLGMVSNPRHFRIANICVNGISSLSIFRH